MPSCISVAVLTLIKMDYYIATFSSISLFCVTTKLLLEGTIFAECFVIFSSIENVSFIKENLYKKKN